MKILLALFFLCHLAIAERPNIILIMADDLGYSDIGCYGGEIATPNIDKICEEGMRFHNFYNNSKCGPTRASLLTGKYAHKVTFRNQVTFAEILQSAGYRTLMAGKWHQPDTPIDYGFDRYTGLLDGCCNYWNPGINAREGELKPGRKPYYVKNNKARVWGIEGEKIEGYTPKSQDFYTTDVFTDYAVERLEEYKDEENPFLLYLAYTAPHYPLHAWPQDIAKYAETYKVGWDVIRQQRYTAQQKLGLISEGTTLPPRDANVPSWDSLSASKKKEEAHKMAVYAAMVDRMDQGVGKVLKKLDEIGKRENTVVIFLSDNGGSAETPDADKKIPAGAVESYRTLGAGWANVTNTPYRRYKTTMNEGGVKTPMVVRWPKKIQPKSETRELGHVMDFLPSFMELADAEFPAEIRGKKQSPFKGRSLVPAFLGQSIAKYDSLCFTFANALGMIQEDWKLIKESKKDAQWELYNLKQDPNEMKNVVAQYPERVEAMIPKLEAWNKGTASKKK